MVCAEREEGGGKISALCWRCDADQSGGWEALVVP